MLIYAAAAVLTASSPGPSSTDLVSTLITWGPGGVVLGLIILGVLEPSRFRKMVETDRDSWKSAFSNEQEAHQLTRVALAKAEERAEAALETARTTASLLEELNHRKTRQTRST